MATTRNSTPDCAIDVPMATFDEDDSIVQLCHDSVFNPHPQQVRQKCDLCHQERCVHISHARAIGDDIQEQDPEEITGCVHKWYFKESQAGALHAESTNASARTQSVFQCTDEYQPPMKRDASIRYTSWLLNTETCKEKTYTITIAVLTKDMQIDGIESITFSLSADSGRSYYSVERITRQRLQSLIIPTTGMSKWQLHRELDASAGKGDQLMTMEVRLSNEALFSQLNPGSIEIQFIELNSQRPRSLGLSDPFLRVHRPQLLALDIEHKDTRFLYLAFSGNGEYLVTLRTTRKQFLVEFWDLRYLDAADTPSPPLSQSKSCATLYIPLARIQDSKGEIPEYPFQISASWDATQIAVVFTGNWPRECPLIQDFQGYFGLYRSSAAGQPYQPSLTDYQHCKRLHNFGGGAKFHISAAENQDVRNELYIACTGQEVIIYCVHGRWKLLRTITLTPPTKNPHSGAFFAWGVIERLQGRFFLWYDNANNDMAIWDIEKGAIVSYFSKKGPCTLWTIHEDDVTGLSRDGSTLAFYRQGEVTTYRMASGTILASCLLPPGYEDVTAVRFIRQDSQILLCARAQDEDYGAGNLGLILDAATLSVEHRFVVPSGALFVRYAPRQKYDSIYSIESELSTLELWAVEDLIRRPYALQHLARHEPCLGPLAPLNKSSTEFTSATGLIFTAQIVHSREPLQDFESPSVIIHIRCTSGGSRTFVIPPLPEPTDMFGDIDFGRTYRAAVFVEAFSRLVVQSPDFLMAWSLPTTLEGDFVLLLAWSTSGLPTGSRWVTCAHQQLYSCRTLPDAAGVTGTASSINVLYPDIDHAFFSSSKEYFLDGILIAIEVFDRANEECKQAILRYFGRYINSYPVSDDLSANVMSKICHTWTPELRKTCRQFTEALLSTDSARWVPRLDMDRQWNPLGILLQKSKTEPRAMGLAQVIMDYCVRQATQDGDLSFLHPITQCLDEFTNQKHPHWDLALSTLQQIAFIPAKDRSFVIDNHAIAYPVAARFQWELWKAQLPPLYKCKDPVLQLMHAPDKTRNAQNDNFTRSLYITSFDLLWSRRPDPSNRPSLRSGNHAEQGSIAQLGSKLSWVNVLVQLIRLKCRLKSSKAIECHDLQLEAFDNPAISALIEYKWNTIGFKYWLARFLFQCCFYILILTTVLMQVYGTNSGVLPGMFIAIIVFACVFLWLEATQLARDWSRYLSSVYNYVDLAAFGLPLAGSINQLVARLSKDITASRSGVLSFSILFVSLHILFELRINRSVCHYVTIIIRIFSEIRAFFLIFAGGIIAFTIAILHLLYACLGDTCPERIEGGFSLHFYKAISSTYFFMGGRYDAISSDLDSDNWAFHTMMIIYFFFTVILMLNVLIGLVNLAFNDGDRTWRLVWLENRLRYIESAENLSYKVPGFRQTCSWFPDEIYYSATPQEIKEYRKRWVGDDNEASVKTKNTSPMRLENPTAQSATAIPTTSRDSSRQNLQELKEQLQEEFKRELQAQLTEQRREQQQLFEAQIRMLQEHMSTLMKSVP